jgi:hypothetical protein
VTKCTNNLAYFISCVGQQYPTPRTTSSSKKQTNLLGCKTGWGHIILILFFHPLDTTDLLMGLHERDNNNPTTLCHFKLFKPAKNLHSNHG